MGNFDWSNFHWVGLVFWVLIVVALLFLVIGIVKKTWKPLIISGLAFLLPSLYFGGAENWFRLFVLTPLLPFILAFAYFTKKKIRNV